MPDYEFDAYAVVLFVFAILVFIHVLRGTL